MQSNTAVDFEQEPLSEDVILHMAESFKALFDPTRLQKLALLFNGERTVGDLVDHLDVSQRAASHQIRI